MTPRGTLPRYRAAFRHAGHGGSDAPVGAYTMTRLADDVVALMDELDIAQAHFCGVSVGGMVAQTLGVRHPERLLSLTLVDTIHHTPLEARAMWANRIGRWKRMAWRDRRVDAGTVADRTVPRAAPEIVERIRKMLLETPVRGYVGVAQAIEAFDLARAISRIHCPTLVVVGDKDEGSPVSMAESIAREIHGARLEVLPDAAHLSFIEQPERFHAIFDAFLGHAACGGQCDIP
jgi:3-oxoadipate enol-lactonase